MINFIVLIVIAHYVGVPDETLLPLLVAGSLCHIASGVLEYLHWSTASIIAHIVNDRL